MLGNISVSYNKFICPAYGVVCRQTVPYTTWASQKSCTAVRFICCNQCRLWAGDFVCWAYGKLCIAIRFICCSQCRILSIRKTLFCIHIFLLRSFSHFEIFLTADPPFLVDNYCNPQYFQRFSNSFSFPPFRVSDNVRSFFGDFRHILQLLSVCPQQIIVFCNCVCPLLEGPKRIRLCWGNFYALSFVFNG